MKGKGETATTIVVYMEEMVEKFKKNFALVSFLSGTVMRGVWFVDSATSHHMMGSWDLFTSLFRGPKYVNVELGDEANYAIEGTRTIEFQMDSSGSWR